jgi:hypothetical protein
MLDIAAVLLITAARLREALTVRRHHHIAAPHELARKRQGVAARLHARVAWHLAVIKDDHRERARTVRLVHRRFKRDRAARVDGHANDLLVETGAGKVRVVVQCDAGDFGAREGTTLRIGVRIGVYERHGASSPCTYHRTDHQKLSATHAQHLP